MNIDNEFSVTGSVPLKDEVEDSPGAPHYTTLKTGTSTIPKFQREVTGARTVPILNDTGLPTGETQIVNEDLTTVLAALTANFFYRFAMQMHLTILPYYAQKFDASPTQIGTLFAVANITMVPTTLFLGRFSDKYGRRIAYLMAVGGIFFVWGFAALAWNYYSLLIARVLTGFCMGSSGLVVSVIKDMFDDTKIPQYIGYATLLSAIGKILAPPIASGMSQFSIRAPLWAGGALNLFGTILLYFFLQETNPAVIEAAHKKNDDYESNDKKKPLLEDFVEHEPREAAGAGVGGALAALNEDEQFIETEEVAESKITWQIYFIFYGMFVCGFAAALTLSMLALYLDKEYNTGSVTYGFYLLGFELISTSFLTFGYPFLVSTMGIYLTLMFSLSLGGLGYVIMALDEWSVWVAVVGAGIAVTGQSVLKPSLQVMLSYAFEDKSKAGNIIALSMASLSAGSVVSPLLSGPLFSMSPKLPFWVGAIVMIFTAVAVQIARWFGLEPELDEDDEMTDEEFEARSSKMLAPTEITPPKLADFTKLGTWLGNLLTERQYDWVGNFAQLQKTLDRVFPPKVRGRLTGRMKKRVSNVRGGIGLIKQTTLMHSYSRQTIVSSNRRATLANGFGGPTQSRRMRGTVTIGEYQYDPALALQANSAAVL